MARLRLDPGRLAARLDLEAPQDVDDGQGGSLRSFEPRGRLWALVEPTGLRIDEAAGAARVTHTFRVTVRRRSDIESGMRLRWDTRVLRIRAVSDPYPRGDYLLCACEEDGQ